MTERFLLWKGELLMSNETRNHKDNVFCMLYREKKNLLSLYNAVNGTNYENEEELEVVTLEDAICMKIRNDAACVIDSRLNLYEQQSTANENMPLRDLYYVTEELKKIAPPTDLYQNKKVSIPAPRFIVFYNGTAERPERQVYKLSDMFAAKEEEPELELKVTVFNISRGYNRELLERCESLRGYMILVEKVREKKAAKIPLETAVSEAVAECISENVLAGFFREHRKEIVKMGIFEFDQELHDQAMRKDGEVIGYEKGINDGMEFSKIELVCKKLAKKKSPETIAEELEEDIGKILPICEVAKAFAPEYDSEKVREKYFAGS